MLEGLISTAPKRLDVWNVYIDQEIGAFKRRHAGAGAGAGAGASKAASAATAAARASDLAYLRTLFERLVTLKLSSKKAKFAFKKFLTFEREHGDASGVSRVQEAVKAYMQRAVAAAGGGAGGGGDGSDEDE